MKIVLRQFIHHPIILASIDKGYFRRAAGYVGSFRNDEHDGKTVTPGMSTTGTDLKGPLRRGREETLQRIGILGMP